MARSNYDQALEQAQRLFLTYDQQPIAEKLRLQQDDDFLFLPFFGRLYRVCRSTGLVQWLDEAGQAHNAGFNDGMAVYDVLCWSKPDCRAAGQFAPINSVARSFHSSGLGESLFDKRAEVFARDPDRLEQICIGLGGVKEGRGDVAYRLELFPFLSIRLQLWLADEDFPASIQLLWDTNTLDFLHYETTYYIAGHIFSLLREQMEQA